MKKLILIAVLAAVAWYGYPYYKDRLETLPREFAGFVSGLSLPSFGGGEPSSGGEALPEQVLEKCITADGRVIYGDVPAGVACERREKVEGSLTVVPSEAIRDGSGLPLPVDPAQQK